MAELPPPVGPPAGWYPDPYDPSRQRYWDGRAWDLSAMPTTAAPFGGGSADDFPDVGDWLDRGFRAAYRRWRAVLVLALLTAPITSVCTNLAIDRAADGVVISDDSIDGWTNDRLPIVIVLAAVAIIVSIIGGLAMYRLMLDTIDGHEPSSLTFGAEAGAAIRSLGGGLAAMPRAIGWSLVLGLALVGVVLVMAVLALGAGALVLLGVLVLIPVAIFLAIRWAFFVTALVDGAGNPFTKSSAVSRGRWWPTFGRLLLLGIILWLISLVIQIIATVLGGGGFGGFGGGTTFEVNSDGTFETIVLDDELQITTWGTIVGVLTSILGSLFATSVGAAATAVLYRTRNARR